MAVYVFFKALDEPSLCREWGSNPRGFLHHETSIPQRGALTTWRSLPTGFLK